MDILYLMYIQMINIELNQIRINWNLVLLTQINRIFVSFSISSLNWKNDPFADLWCNNVIYLQSEPAFCLSSKKQTTSLSNTVKTLEETQADMEKRLSVLQEEHQRDTSQLEQGNSRIKELQKEVIPTIVENESRTAWDSLAGMSQKSSAPKKRPGPWIHSVCVCVCYWLGSLLLMKGFYSFSFFLSMRRSSQSCQASGRSLKM